MPAPRINLSDDVISRMSPEQRKEFGVKTREEINAKIDEKDERAIQDKVEGWLTLRGYWPRTPAFLRGQVPPRGWFIHLHKAKCNPYLLDLLILDCHKGRYLELELKTKTGKLSDEQMAIMAGGNCKLARAAEEAASIVIEWEHNDG